MVWFILAFVLLVVVIVGICASSDNDPTEKAIFSAGVFVVGGLIFFGLSCWMCALTSGFFQDYSEGVREGYVNKCSTSGVVWKTREGELQIGAGEQAALQAPWEFSCSDPEVWKKIEENKGKRVSLHYKQWVILPYRQGATNYLVTGVDVIKAEEQPSK